LENEEAKKVQKDLTYDLLIKNAQIVQPNRTLKGEIAISNGKIEAIGITLSGSFRDSIDIGGRFILPGVIDTHVHLGTTDQTFAEAVRTESAAAAAGGVTTALVFKRIPILSDQGDSLVSALTPDIRAIEEGSLIDIGFHGLILDEDALERIDELAEEFGITSFKFIMAYKGEEAMPHFYGMDDGSLFKCLEKVGKMKGCVSLIHAENSEINERFKRENFHRQDIGAWSDSRPSFSEEEGIRRSVFLAERAGSPLCVPHVSTEGGARYIAEVKKSNKYLFQETCPHYLFLTKETRFEPPSVGKVNPPLRARSDVSALWALMASGEIDVVGSDHCPFTRKFKPGDLWSARPGFPGIGLILPILLSEGINKGTMRMEDISRITSFQPAKLFGLYPRKGIIEIGSDADFVVVDLEKEVKVRPAILHGISDYSPYEGYVAKGWPILTIARGRIVFRDGQIDETMRKGMYLKRRMADFA
jgi:dihydroorotase (multifunctional complex type)